jgi:hypothetical protein
MTVNVKRHRTGGTTRVNRMFTMLLCRRLMADYKFVMARWRSGNAKAVQGLSSLVRIQAGPPPAFG